MPQCSVAVHLHAFYQDLIPDFVEALSAIPVPFDCYVSVPDTVQYDDHLLRQQMGALENLKQLLVRRTPNKGRDLAPMLCSFAEEIREHDIVLHVHTKKSPHDSIQQNWLPYILDHLLCSREVVSGILGSLAADIGILASSDFLCNSTTDGWCHERNIICAQKIIDRSSLQVNLRKSYPQIDFPQGSMFWARTDYLRPLFDMHLTYDDFDPEPISVDGTMAHGLERLFFLWGLGTGRCPAKLFASRSELYLYQYRAAVLGQLIDMLNRQSGKAKKRLCSVRRLLGCCILLSVLCLAMLSYILLYI